MPNPLAVMPDDELATIQYLRSIPQVVALVDPTHIVTQLPDKPVWPYVTINRIGGTAVVRNGLDEAAQQIDVIGGTKQQCKQLVLAVRAAILAIANDTVPAGVLSSADEEVGPSWLPDTVPVPPVPRYVLRCRLYLHP